MVFSSLGIIIIVPCIQREMFTSEHFRYLASEPSAEMFVGSNICGSMLFIPV